MLGKVLFGLLCVGSAVRPPQIKKEPNEEESKNPKGSDLDDVNVKPEKNEVEVKKEKIAIPKAAKKSTAWKKMKAKIKDSGQEVANRQHKCNRNSCYCGGT